jgi:DUF1680 family protein
MKKMKKVEEYKTAGQTSSNSTYNVYQGNSNSKSTSSVAKRLTQVSQDPLSSRREVIIDTFRQIKQPEGVIFNANSGTAGTEV